MVANPSILVIELAGVPVAKGRPKFASIGGRPRAYSPSKTRHYEDGLRLAAQAVMAGRPLLAGALIVRVTARLPVPGSWSQKKQRAAIAGTVPLVTRPDVDNYAKIALDALNCVVFTDDSHITELHVSKHYSDKPGLTVEIVEH